MIEKYIKNTFIDTDTITKEDIFLFFNKLDISVSTKKKILYILKSTLAFSYEHQYLKEFINLGDIKFNKKCHTIFILSKEEQNILETYLKNKVNIRKICLLLCLYTGLRVGEVSGLKWEDIDFYKHALCVKRTILRIKQGDKTMLIESTPKSETSNRVIPIPDFLICLLSNFKNNDNYFLLTKDKKLYDPRLLESFYKRVLEKCKISHNKFHTLRHTFATRCIESKMDIKSLSEILGHSSVEITLKLYIHPSYEMKKTQLENLVKFMEKN